jgi:peptide-methionine (S)-S-oxide reductase
MGIEIATLGAGCFWCVEAVFDSLKGVKQVDSGYTGGQLKDPSYKEICSGTTGHAEVTRITYDSSIIAFSALLEVFWATHDPTTLNRQGADSGTQYRSVIYYHSEEQKSIALKSKEAAGEAGLYPNPIVTEVSAAETFYEAENYHHDYLKNNPEQGYCKMVIKPKLDKFKKMFTEKIRG